MFHKKNFCHVSSTNRGCPQYSIYVYKTTDSVETMLTEGYFNEALLDLQKNDVIAAAIISETDNTEYKRVYFRVTQRTLDGVSVEQIITDANDISFDGTGTTYIENAKNVQEALNGLDAAVDTKVSKAGDTMTGPLVFSSYGVTVSLSSDSLGTFYIDRGSVEYRFQSNAFTTNASNIDLGTFTQPFRTVYATKLYNGENITIPSAAGTLTLNEVNFQTPVTDTNKGATMKEIIDVQNTSIKFKGFVSTTEPSSSEFTLFEGNMWINASAMPTSFPVPATSIRVWDGTAWQTTTDSYTPAPLDAWRNENDNEGYYWFGGVWAVMSTDLSPDYFALDPTDGKWDIKNSVNLPGNPTTTTPSSDSDNTQIPTTAWVRDTLGTFTTPVGAIIAFAGKTAPDGFLKCDGSAVSRSVYANLFAVIGTTYSHGVYAWASGINIIYTNFDVPATGETAEGVYFDENGTELGTAVYDESTGTLTATPADGTAPMEYTRSTGNDKPTFDLPDGEGCSLWGNTPSVVKAGLPNITGTIAQCLSWNGTKPVYSGAFSSKRSTSTLLWTGTGEEWSSPPTYSFDASTSNTIYGSADTVRPPSIGVVFCIKY